MNPKGTMTGDPSREDDSYTRIPAGAYYVDPEGNLRTKPRAR